MKGTTPEKNEVPRGFKGKVEGIISASYGKFLLYGTVLSSVGLLLSILAISDAYYHVLPQSLISSQSEAIIFSSFNTFGYAGYSVLLLFSPLPDYVIVPFYAYLSSTGIFNVYDILVVSVLVMAVFRQAEYYAGRYGGRPIVEKILKYMRIPGFKLRTAEKWIGRHGFFAVFGFTFIPYTNAVIALSSGFLKMNSIKYLSANLAGYALRFSFLAYIGYNGIDILHALASKRFVILPIIILIVSSAYIFFYFIFRNRTNENRQIDVGSTK